MHLLHNQYVQALSNQHNQAAKIVGKSSSNPKSETRQNPQHHEGLFQSNFIY